ncbi:MAG TPA: DHA2 family efflux MFS transporter permease subunit [Candidatus Baltobacteraceae bacterium]|jgi:MFS transporter, DHA2 family, multidrug resistance protein|nr:DHA2 family efflux MFS transporter permease subunit [Candidatus Baltobacteraceae bacterium]
MSSEALALPAEQAIWRPRVNPWAIGATVSMAAFVEVLDTSVANVALPYIAGGLGASYDDSTWVLTSYLAANAIILPISGWLAEIIGRKRYFMLSLFIFTLSSLLCGLAPSLPVLLFFRAVQGVGGGGLQPMAQAILNDSFPPEKRGVAFALYGISAVLAPTVGPMLGGWITDNYSWRWIFFITLPVVSFALYLTHVLVEDPPFLHRLKRGGIRVDYIGISMLALGVGSLQVLLDKGQEDDWLGSHFITTLAITATVCLITLVIWEWFRKEPIIDVRMFKSFNFAAANLMMFMMGFMLFSTLVLIPEFLQTLMGYTAELAGLVLSGGGLVLLAMMPITGRLTSKIQARYLIAAGWLCLAVGLFYSAHKIDLYVSFGFATWLRITQVVGIGFLFVPITAAGYIGIPAEKGNSVSGIINFMRNIGGSIGTSLVTTLIVRRSQYHQQILVGHITPDTPAYRAALRALSSEIAHSGLRATDARDQAIARFYNLIDRQSHALSYMDIFWILGAFCAVMFVLAFFLKKNDPGAGGAVAAG